MCKKEYGVPQIETPPPWRRGCRSPLRSILVGQDLGAFVWRDGEGEPRAGEPDGIAQLDEFFPETTPLEGTYLRTFVPGTDLGGSFAYHRELELFQEFGLSPAEVLRRASFDMATYLGQVEDLGSIEKDKFADFFLVPGDPTANLDELRRIRMVVSDGVVYFPSEIYPHFGIKPFIDAPTLTEVTTAQ